MGSKGSGVLWRRDVEEARLKERNRWKGEQGGKKILEIYTVDDSCIVQLQKTIADLCCI